MKYYKSDKGYFYKVKNNGDKIRISQDTFNKNIKVGGVNINTTLPQQQPDTFNNSYPLQKDKSILYYLGITLGKDFIVITRQDIKNKVNKIPPFISKVFEDNPTLIMFVYKEQIIDGICIYQVNNTINIKQYINTVSTSPTSPTSPTSKLLSYSINLNTPLNSKLYKTTYNNKIRIISDEVKKLLPPNTVYNTNVNNNQFVKKRHSILYYLGIVLGKKYKVITRKDINKKNNNENNNKNRSTVIRRFNIELNLIMIIYQKDISDGICIFQDGINITIKPYNQLRRQIKTFSLVQDIKLSNTSYNINRRISNSIIKDISQEVEQLFSEINVSSSLLIMPN